MTFTKMAGGAISFALVVGGAAATVFSTSAYAQEDADAENILEEVYVTATKRDERLLDVPMAVTAVSGKDLIERNLLQIEDFADQVPGLVIQQFGHRATRIILRGLNSGGAGATVAGVIDESMLSYSVATTNGAIDIANIDTYDLNRVEVLRGPQGTLYGAAANGGIIKYVTNAPNLDSFQGDAEFGLDKIHQGEIGLTGRGMLNVPFADGKAAFRVTGFYKELPGYIDNFLAASKNANDGERYGARAQLLFEPTENLSIRLMAMMQDQDYYDNGSVELVGAAFTPTIRTADEFDIANDGDLQWNTPNSSISDNGVRLYYAIVDWTTENVNILSATTYGEVNSTFRNDLTFAEAAPGVPLSVAFSCAFGCGPITIWGNQTNDLGKFNQEFRFSSPDTVSLGSIGMDWQLGAFYSKEDITFNQFFDTLDANTGEILLTNVFVPLGFGLLPTGGSTLPADYEEYSGFGNVVLRFNEQFDVALGARYSENTQHSQVTNFAGLINAPFDIVNPEIRTKENKFTWSIAPTFHFTPDQMIYARVATGYRPGGPSLAIPGAPPDFPLSYDPDNTVNYEIGTKGVTDAGTFTWDVAAFYIDWTDIQILTQFVSSTSGQTFTITGNGGTATSKGLEWDFAWQATENLMVGVKGAYTSAKLTEDARGLGGYDGDQLPYVPDWQNTVNLDYSTEIGRAFVTFGATWAYIGNRYTGFGAPPVPELDRFPGTHLKLPSYSTFAAQVVANWEQWRFRAFIQNITDERALTQYATGGGYQATGVGQIIQPRTYGFSVGISF